MTTHVETTIGNVSRQGVRISFWSIHNKGTTMKIFDMFKRNEIPMPELSTMRTVNPSDGQVKGLPDHTKPTSRMDVLQVIEDNVTNELESIDYEVTKLKVRLIDLYNRRRKYVLILNAAKDDGSCVINSGGESDSGVV